MELITRRHPEFDVWLDIIVKEMPIPAGIKDIDAFKESIEIIQVYGNKVTLFYATDKEQ